MLEEQINILRIKKLEVQDLTIAYVTALKTASFQQLKFQLVLHDHQKSLVQPKQLHKENIFNKQHLRTFQSICRHDLYVKLVVYDLREGIVQLRP